MPSQEVETRVDANLIELGNRKLTDPGVIEFLVLNQRFPTFFPLYHEERFKELKLSCVLVEIPPEGVSAGDTRMPSFSLGMPCEYVSPEGVGKGFSKIYEVTAEEGSELYERAKKAKRLVSNRFGKIREFIERNLY
jgi:hypothetical protein